MEAGNMGKFTIQPHGRLQEWIAHEKGYFRDEGLDYEFGRGLAADSVKQIDASGKVAEVRSGAFESYKQAGGNKGVKSDISCACHWAVNQASSQRIGTMWGKSYVVTPGGVMVPPDSPIRRPEDLAGQEVAVGYHSGSHFTTVQALEPFLDREPERYKHFYLNEIPERYKSRIDVRLFSPGERIVFLPYGEDTFARTQA